MKGLVKMRMASRNENQHIVWKGFGGETSRCAEKKCAHLTTGRAKNLRTGKTRPMCEECAVAKGIADKGA